MGCRTGFLFNYVGWSWTTNSERWIRKGIKMVLEATEIPAATESRMWNYKDLSLFGAKEYAKEALGKDSLLIYTEIN